MKKRRSISLILMSSCLVVLTISSCYFDNAEELLTCFPTDVSYREDVVPIMERRCYECHDLTNAPALGNGINLEGYSKMLQYLESNESKFIGAITWNGQGTPMPENGTKLDNCSINKLETWILEGKTNN